MAREEVKELAKKIKEADTWDLDLCAQLCDEAGMAYDWERATGETFEAVVLKAADLLNVEII